MNKFLSLFTLLSCSAAFATDVRLDMSLIRNGECVMQDWVTLNESMVVTPDADCDPMVRKQCENCDNCICSVTLRKMNDEGGTVQITVWRKTECGRVEMATSATEELIWGIDKRVPLELDGDCCEVILLGTKI